MSSPYLLTAAIDFGTTFSGYAYSTRQDFESDPLRIISPQFVSGNVSLMSMKTPSCILFDPRQRFHSFGYEAETHYGDLTVDGDHYRDWFYFRRFKMMLYQSKNVHQGMTIKDELGKEMKALDVFAAAIQFLKDHLLQHMERTMSGFTERDVKWVLTVPAIWDDIAKGFMRQAAIHAGIHHENLQLALEPEAAAMFCKYMKVDRTADDNTLKCFMPSSRYLVLDAGGGTVDITVHEVQPDRTLRELYKANGGPWGGTTVDEAFFKLLSALVGDDVWESYKQHHQDDLLELQKEFEVRKRSINPAKEQGKVTFRIPISLLEYFRENNGGELSQKVRTDQRFAGKVTFAGDKLRIESSTVEGLFAETIRNITDHLKELFRRAEVKGTNIILMVGGFSESPMLQEAIKREFRHLKVIIPQDPGLAVLKGAVIYGHSSKDIASRISKYTYGINSRASFDPKVHPQSKRYVQRDGQEKVRKVFSILVHAGEKVVPGEPCPPHVYFPSEDGHASFNLRLFASPRADPQYVDEPDCIQIGEVKVNCRDRFGRVGGAAVSLMFGGTEIQVSAVNNLTKEITEAKFTTI